MFVCLIIFSRFGLEVSLFFFVQTLPTSSEGFTVLYSSNSNTVNCLASSIGWSVSNVISRSGTCKWCSIAGGLWPKANVICLWLASCSFCKFKC